MMKKNILWAGCLVIAMAMCAACGKNEAAATTAATVTTAAAAAETPEESSQEETAEEMPGGNIVNPLTEHTTKAELQKTIGFMMPDFPENFGLKSPVYISIDGTLGEIQEETADGNAVCIRKAAGDEDISGYYGVTYEDSDIQGIPVHLGKSDNTSIMWWTREGYSYSLTVDGIEGDDLWEYQSVLLKQADFQEVMILDLPNAQEVYRTVEELNDGIGFPVLELPEVYQMTPAVIGIDENGEGYLRYREGMTNDKYIDMITVKDLSYQHILEQDVALEEAEINGVKVQEGAADGVMEGLRFGKWSEGEFTYTTVSLGQTEEEFTTLLEYLTNATK